MDSIAKMLSKRDQLEARIANIDAMIEDARRAEEAAGEAIQMGAPEPQGKQKEALFHERYGASGKIGEEVPTAAETFPDAGTVFANEVTSVAEEVADENRYELAKMTYRLAEKMASLSTTMQRLGEDIKLCHARGADVNFLGNRKKVRELLDDLGHRNGVGY